MGLRETLRDLSLWQAVHGFVHYDDVTMSGKASQITSLTIVYSTVYPGADQRKHQSPAPLAFVRGIHRGPVNSPHKWPAKRKMFPFDDVIMFCNDRWRLLMQYVKFVCRMWQSEATRWERSDGTKMLPEPKLTYRQVSNIRRTKSQHLKVSRTALQHLQNPLKPDVKSIMKM